MLRYAEIVMNHYRFKNIKKEPIKILVREWKNKWAGQSSVVEPVILLNNERWTVCHYFMRYHDMVGHGLIFPILKYLFLFEVPAVHGLIAFGFSRSIKSTPDRVYCEMPLAHLLMALVFTDRVAFFQNGATKSMCATGVWLQSHCFIGPISLHHVDGTCPIDKTPDAQCSATLHDLIWHNVSCKQ